MHSDPRDPLDEHEADSAASTPEGENAELTRIPPTLRNWQVLDEGDDRPRPPFTRKPDPDDDTGGIYRGMIIDGEARIVREVESTPARWDGPEPELSDQPIHDHVDDFVAAELAVRRVTVTPGEAVELAVEVANHGRWAALFEVNLEGWIDESWCPELPVRVHLEPEMRRKVSVGIAPPRSHTVQVGEHPIAVVVRSARYPGHVTRLAAVLVVEPYIGLKVGTPQPSEVRTSWFSPAATLHLPLRNTGNTPATVHVQGLDADRQVDFTFLAGSAALADDGLVDSPWGGNAQVVLGPGQNIALPVEIRPRRRPLIGLTPRHTPIRFVARVATDPPLRRTAEAAVTSSALFGPWQLAIGGVLMVLAFFGVGLMGLALLVALRSAAASSPLVQPAPVATAAPPAVTFVIQMNQPMPTRSPVVDGSAGTGALAGADSPRTAAPVQPPTAPLVRADQVTAPGEPTPEGQLPLRPIVTAPEAGVPVITAPQAPPAGSQANMTYGQMFKAVAQQYDLDWRMLAAVAYLESGFDSLALSDQGAMGLMQVHPETWREFAPKVDVGDPFDAYGNVLVGAFYLDYLRTFFGEQGYPDVKWMLVAYNWGPDKVMNHIRAGGTWDTLNAERRQYADDVLRIMATIPAQ